MVRLDDINISVGNKSNEENLQIIKAWCGELADAFNLLIAQVDMLNQRLETLEREDK